MQIKKSSILVYNNTLEVKKLKSMISLLEERNKDSDQFLVLNSEHFAKKFSDKYISRIDAWFLHEDLLKNENDEQYLDFIDRILNKNESVYLVNLVPSENAPSKYELTLIDVNQNGVLSNKKQKALGKKVIADQKVSANSNLTIPLDNNPNYLNQQSV